MMIGENKKMKVFSKILVCMTMAIAMVGCTTSGKFVIPEGTDLYIYERPDSVDVETDGTVTVEPFFWTAMGVAPAGGVPYRLEKNGEVVKEGKLRAVFRGVSLFWPPVAVIYWPIGLNPNITYDLVNDTQE